MLSPRAFNTLLDRIICADALAFLRGLPDESVNCIVTSPPYFGLRDYQVRGQIGLEKTPAEYVATMVQLFREARRVLKADGTLWLNLGDSYAGAGKDGGSESKENGRREARMFKAEFEWELPAKNLLMIPARVAIALQEDGWYLRSEIVWHKPNAMPESVKDRPTKAHEMIYLLTKSASYWYDWEAIQENRIDSTKHKNTDTRGRQDYAIASGMGIRPQRDSNGGLGSYSEDSRNKRTVWTVPTHPFAEAHFATFPPDLIEPMILAGCPKGGVVLDMFMGAGTTALVARKLNRHFIGAELNAAYIEIAKRRLYTPMDLWLQAAS